MPILTVLHTTTYAFRQPVSFGEHRIMARPRDSKDQRLIEARLEIAPEPAELRWVQDPSGNEVALARFRGRAREMRVRSLIRVDHAPVGQGDVRLSGPAQQLPVAYDADEAPDLARCIERHHPDPGHEVDAFARGFLREDGPTGTLDCLAAMTQAIERRFAYRARHEPGIQDPTRTIRLGSGACRDFALLMIEAARSLGLAARFVSGYIHVPYWQEEGQEQRRGGGSTHAWVQVYLPGAGWTEFDPTNGIVGTRDLVRVAVARTPGALVPLSGIWTGFPGDDIGMEVEVQVTSQERPADEGAVPVPRPAGEIAA